MTRRVLEHGHLLHSDPRPRADSGDCLGSARGHLLLVQNLGQDKRLRRSGLGRFQLRCRRPQSNASVALFGWCWVVAVGSAPIRILPIAAWMLPESLEYLVAKGGISEAKALAAKLNVKNY